MTKKHLPRYLKPAGWLKEAGAFLIDFALAGILALLLFASVGNGLIYKAFGGDSAQQQYSALMVEAGFAYVDEQGQTQEVSIDTHKRDVEFYVQYERIESVIWEYFYNVIPTSSNFDFLESDGFSSSAEVGTAQYRSDVGAWIYQTMFHIGDEANPNPYFALPSEGFAFAEMPKPSATQLAKMSSSDKEVQLAAYKDIYNCVVGSDSNDASSIFYATTSHFKMQPEVIKLEEKSRFAMFASFYPSIILAPLIFFFIIPMCSSTGQTLGKRILKIAVLGRDGYAPNKGKIAMHSAFMTLPYYFLLIPYPLYTFMGLSLYLLIDYIVLVLHPNHQSLHALIAQTIVVKTDSSIWFANKEAEDSYIATHPNSLAAKIRREEDGVVDLGARKISVSEAAAKEELGLFDASTLALNPHIKDEELDAKKPLEEEEKHEN